MCVLVCVGTAISRTRLGRSSRRRAAGCGDGGGGGSVRALERESEIAVDERSVERRRCGGVANIFCVCVYVCV